jgi:hypothetical protein
VTLENQLQASLDIIELRKRDSVTLAAIIKAAQAELAARKAKLRSDVAELAKAKKALQRQAAELSAAGYRVRARAQRKDKGSKRAPRPAVRLLRVTDGPFAGSHIPVTEHLAEDIAELNALDKAADDAECADEAARDEYDSRHNLGGEP